MDIFDITYLVFIVQLISLLLGSLQRLLFTTFASRHDVLCSEM